jgi:hypothetical protein
MSFIAASCRLLWLQHHAGFTATWAAAATSISSYIFIVASDATPILLWDYTAMKAVWDHTKSFLRHHCRLWLRHHAGFTCGITADLILRLIGRLAWSLYCSSMSSCDLHVVLYLYSGINATSTLLSDYAAMKVVGDHTRSFLRHHCQLYLRHYCRLASSSHRTTCGITANLNDLYTAHWWAVATSMLSYIFIVALMPLPHSCGIMLLWKRYETIQGLSCGITTDFDSSL